MSAPNNITDSLPSDATVTPSTTTSEISDATSTSTTTTSEISGLTEAIIKLKIDLAQCRAKEDCRELQVRTLQSEIQRFQDKLKHRALEFKGGHLEFQFVDKEIEKLQRTVKSLFASGDGMQCPKEGNKVLNTEKDRTIQSSPRPVRLSKLCRRSSSRRSSGYRRGSSRSLLSGESINSFRKSSSRSLFRKNSTGTASTVPTVASAATVSSLQETKASEKDHSKPWAAFSPLRLSLQKMQSQAKNLMANKRRQSIGAKSNACFDDTPNETSRKKKQTKNTRKSLVSSLIEDCEVLKKEGDWISITQDPEPESKLSSIAKRASLAFRRASCDVVTTNNTNYDIKSPGRNSLVATEDSYQHPGDSGENNDEEYWKRHYQSRLTQQKERYQALSKQRLSQVQYRDVNAFKAAVRAQRTMSMDMASP